MKMTHMESDICVNISEIKSNTADVNRIDELKIFFQQKFNISPQFLVKVPGRVNIIGEHVDYCGYPVLPMAIEQNILLAVTPSANQILRLENINPKYKPVNIELNDLDIESNENGGAPEWYNYFLCGVKGVLDAFHAEPNALKGMMVAVSGNVPPASGLSSSSALVSAAVLATSYRNNFSLEKEYLATVSATCECFIGTEGGGMDQAIAFLAKHGCAQFIEWNPLKAKSIMLPKNAVFVIANSLSTANKAATSDFNQRVVECRIGCSILAKMERLDWRSIDRFATLQTMVKATFENMVDLIEMDLPKKLYTIDDILEILEIDVDEFRETLLTANTQHLTEFKLRQRALHVIQESIRVQAFRLLAICNDSIPELSHLMRESHNSLKNLYECSHPNLDKMVEISDRMGIGSRLTGAGWGGCIVALCNSVEQSQQYIDELKEHYYKPFAEMGLINLDSAVFATSPQSGAEIFIF